ncbi:MAG TPA: polyprenyl synthetase family protein [Rectinemataceae bacterium]|nr:polyprenyl synthetase family protein [Rectinemataceae bacterium]
MHPEYTELLDEIEGELRSLLPEEPDEAWFARFFGRLDASPRENLRRALNAPALDLIRRGGKRWRPLLLALAAKAFGREDGALPLSPLVEIAHNGTLIVDDIEDGADTRRGGPAIHLAHGLDVAVNAGNLLYFLPLALIDELDAAAETRLELHARYGLHMRRLHLGQAMDILWHREHAFVPDRGSYLAMCALKTGVLARAAAEFGAIAALAPAAAVETLGSAFERAGVAFQIFDDLRNLTTGNPGKNRGDDIVEGKKSLPVILACETRPAFVGELAALFARAAAEGPSSSAVEEAIARIGETGALAAAERSARALLDQASAELASVLPATPEGRLLADLVPFLEGR